MIISYTVREYWASNYKNGPDKDLSTITGTVVYDEIWIVQKTRLPSRAEKKKQLERHKRAKLISICKTEHCIVYHVIVWVFCQQFLCLLTTSKAAQALINSPTFNVKQTLCTENTAAFGYQNAILSSFAKGLFHPRIYHIPSVYTITHT